MSLSLSRNAPRIDHRTQRARQQSAWASGDYAVVSTALQIVGEELCDTLNLAQDARVLDVAMGNGHASLAAARRWCAVTATDFSPDLTQRGHGRREAENFGVRFVEGEAEALPFGDQSFDVVLSTFGAMFAPDQERAASEMIRVCRRGCQVGLTNWTPGGFIGQLFALIGRHTEQPATTLPFQWGTAERLEDLFGVYGSVWITRKQVAFRYPTAAEWVARFRASYVPVRKAFARLGAEAQRALCSELLELATRFNRAPDASLLIDAEYLEVVVTRR